MTAHQHSSIRSARIALAAFMLAGTAATAETINQADENVTVPFDCEAPLKGLNQARLDVLERHRPGITTPTVDEAKDHAFRHVLGQFKREFDDNWGRPPGLEPKTSAAARIELRLSIEIVEAHLTQSTGNAELDERLLAAILAVPPLPIPKCQPLFDTTRTVTFSLGPEP